MSKYFIVTADGLKARFFQLTHVKDPMHETGPNLERIHEIKNSEQELTSGRVFENVRAGRTHIGSPSSQGGYEDHREDHIREFEQRFAKRIAGEGVNLAKAQNARVIILAANPRMLGFLRQEINEKHLNMEIKELPKNLASMPPREVHSILSKKGLLPTRKKAQLADAPASK